MNTDRIKTIVILIITLGLIGIISLWISSVVV